MVMGKTERWFGSSVLIAICIFLLCCFVFQQQIFSYRVSSQGVNYREIASKYEKVIFLIKYNIEIQSIQGSEKKMVEIIEPGFFVKKNGLFIAIPSYLESQALLLSVENQEVYLSGNRISGLPKNAVVIFDSKTEAKAEFLGINREYYLLMFKIIEPEKFKFEIIEVENYTPELGDEFYGMTKDYNNFLGVSGILLYQAHIMTMMGKQGILSNDRGVVYIHKKTGAIVGVLGLKKLESKETGEIKFTTDNLVTKSEFEKILSSEIEKIKVVKEQK